MACVHAHSLEGTLVQIMILSLALECAKMHCGPWPKKFVHLVVHKRLCLISRPVVLQFQCSRCVVCSRAVIISQSLYLGSSIVGHMSLTSAVIFPSCRALSVQKM